MKEIRLIGTTSGAGAVTVTSESSIFGYLARITWVDGDLADGVDAVLSVINTPSGVNETLYTLTDANDDAVIFPGSSTTSWPGQIIAGTLSLAITSGGSAKTGGMIVYISSVPMPAAAILTGDVEIGAVEIKNATDDTRATVGANGLYVDVRAIAALIAGEAHLGEVGGHKHRVSTEVTRPADTTAYTAKDAIANATSGAVVLTFTGVARIAGGGGYIVKASVMTDQTTCTETFKLHLFNAAPTALQDNAVCTAPLYANAASYVGTISFPACVVEATGATAAYANATPNTSGSNLPLGFVTVLDANLYGLLETPTGFTPASGQKFTIVLVSEVD